MGFKFKSIINVQTLTINLSTWKLKIVNICCTWLIYFCSIHLRSPGMLWLLKFHYACLRNWKYAAADIHMHFLEGTFKEAIFSIFTWRALVRNRTLMISCLCNALFTGLQHDTTLDSLLWISDPVRPRFLAITSSDLAWSLSNFRTLHFSPSADFCQYGLLTKNR